MDLTFSLLNESRVEEAYAVLQRVVDWIAVEGRRQRISMTTPQMYQKWQAEGANFVVTDRGQIVGLVTIRIEMLDEWPKFSSLKNVPMLRALATHPDHHQKGIGAFAVRKAVERCGENVEVYLDCVSGFLPAYYASLGFVTIAEQRRHYADDDPYDITLMRHDSQNTNTSE